MVGLLSADIKPKRVDVKVGLCLENEKLLLVSSVFELRVNEIGEGLLILHVDQVRHMRSFE